jgi:uncharacterized protein
MDLEFFESQFKNRVIQSVGLEDPSHDLSHFKRVVSQAKSLANQESAEMEIVVPAAWLHDLVNVPKNDPRRKQASTLSAESAVTFLSQIDYPKCYFEKIYHAIQAHSFSAGFEAKTIEAKVVQDADRLDALGAIGISRCFSTGGAMKREFYAIDDPFCNGRPADDSKFTLDHFYTKLLKLEATFQTLSGKREARIRTTFMKSFLKQFESEIIPSFKLT